MKYVIDASALLAMLWNEDGAKIVEDNIENSILSSVNLAEIYSKMSDRNIDINQAKQLLESLGFGIFNFDSNQALLCAKLRINTKEFGLSLGDRACMALAIQENLPIITADRIWLKVDIGLKIISIR